MVTSKILWVSRVYLAMSLESFLIHPKPSDGTDLMARLRRLCLPGAQGSPWDPSRCSHGFCLRTQRIELVLPKKPWGCGLIDLVVSLKSTSCNPHFANMVKVVMWQWELSQRTTYRGHTSFYEGIIPRYDTLSPNTKLIDRSKNTWNCSPWQKTFIGYLFFQLTNHRQWGYRQSPIVGRNKHVRLCKKHQIAVSWHYW